MVHEVMDHELFWSFGFLQVFALEVTNFKPWMWERVIPGLKREFLSDSSNSACLIPDS